MLTTQHAPRNHHEMVALLQTVLDHAHAQHTYVTDQKQYGQPEYWKAGTIGDCEDFALYCRAYLKQHHGLDSDLIFCITETGEGHLVLSRDGWILDNRHYFVLRRDVLPYRWLAKGGPGPDYKWTRILNTAPTPKKEA